MMIFVLIVIATGATLFVQGISNTSPTAAPHVIIAFVGNTSPIAGVDHVSVAGIITHNAASSSSSRNTEQKLITVNWGDGTSSQSKTTRIPSSGEDKWGPLYHKYNSATALNSYAIVATSDVLSSSSNRHIVQMSEPYLINVQKGPITGYSSESLRSDIHHVPINELLISPISDLANILALPAIGTVTGSSVFIVRHTRRRNEDATHYKCL